MTRLRRNLLITALGMLLGVVLLSCYALVRWELFKRDHGIEALDISGLRISTDGIRLRQFALTQQRDGARLVLKIESLQLSLQSWTNPLPLDALNATQAALRWQPGPNPATSDDEAIALPDLRQLPRWATWLPRNGRIGSLIINFPCASGICQEVGQLDWHIARERALPAKVSLALEHDGHDLAIKLDASQQEDMVLLDLQTLLDGKPRLALQNQLTPQNETIRWLGSLSLSELPEAPWLLDWIGDWLPYAPPPLQDLPEQMRVGAGWSLVIDTQAPAQGMKIPNGELRLSANLPAPWPVVGIGQLQGQLNLGARTNGSVWTADELAADLTLKPTGELVSALPEPLRPDAVTVRIAPAQTDGSTTGLPLHIQLETSGATPVSIQSDALLDTAAPYALTFKKTRLKAYMPAFSATNVALKGLVADLQLQGRISPRNASVSVNRGSELKIKTLNTTAGLAANDLHIELAGAQVEARLCDSDIDNVTLNAKPTVTIGSLKHPALRTQGWHWGGTLALDPASVSLDGPLANDAGLSLEMRLRRDLAANLTRLDVTLPDVFLRAGNPLATTLADWPQLLELNTGRLQAKAQLIIPPAGPLEAAASLIAKGVGGIYDRAEFSGLDAAVSATVQRDELQLDVAELYVREANPGFSVGPLRYEGHYAAPLGNLGNGRLVWEKAEAQLLGGRLWLEPVAADLSGDGQRLDAHLRGLQLPLLLEAYPAEGLSGTGVIDGELQAQRTPAGISIEQGSLKAREPGGVLQFRSPKIQALGHSNPAMRLVAEALEDFHYDLLASDVRYGTDGKLDLTLKLHGRNPALEGGRPINFSVNLQEDIPALLTSLQLSDRVSETIQRRVQEQLQKSQEP
jgi:hypothetical protein